MLGQHARHACRPGPQGKQVNRLYIEEGSDIAREFYLSLLVDRATGRVAFVVSTEGGMDIEEVAHDTPEKIDHLLGRSGDRRHAASRPRASPRRSGLKGDLAKQAADICWRKLYAAFVAKDMSLLEINPLIVTGDGKLRRASTPRSASTATRSTAIPTSSRCAT